MMQNFNFLFKHTTCSRASQKKNQINRCTDCNYGGDDAYKTLPGNVIFFLLKKESKSHNCIII